MTTSVYVIAANDELFDQMRDELHRANGVSDQSHFILSTVSPTSIPIWNPSSDTVLLLGRTLNQEARKVISNVFRLRFTWDVSNKLIIAKYELTDDDKLAIKEEIECCKHAWLSAWSEELKRLRKLRNCRALAIRIEVAEKWMNRVNSETNIVMLDASSVEGDLSQHFNANGPYHLSPVLGPSMLLKPPALHWASWPHDGELQVSLRVELPENCVTEEFFRDLCEKAKKMFAWEYVYDWVSGVFMKQNEVKILVSEARKTTIEIAARVDMDELEEDHLRAMRSLWPLFAPVVACFAQRSSTIPHMMYLVVVGAPFFNKEIIHHARAFEVTELLCALNVARNVVFRIDDVLIRLLIENVFPDRRPKVAADIWTSDVRIEVVSSPTSPPSDSITFEIEENRAINNESPMLLSAMKSKQKGRRVSFGAIRLLPNFGDEQVTSSSVQLEDTILEDHSVVSDYVDHMLREIMDDTISFSHR